MSPGPPDLLARVAAYYSGKLRAHGPTPRGVDWNSPESQRLRFDQLLEIRPAGEDFTLNDYGCGYGALLDHLDARCTRYSGFDVSPEMVAAARGRHPATPRARFVDGDESLEPADYTVASGIFNVRLETPEADWREYMSRAVDRLDSLSTKGFAFNALTAYSDEDKKRPDLYYADPAFWFDRCKRRHSPYVALRHDYPLYEFTILVRKPGGR